MQPVADAMIVEGCPFEGVLYGGLMKTARGIEVIEFNARFGDPETEVVLPRLKSDIVDIFCAVAEGRDTQLEWHDFAALGIVLASKGYPGSYAKGAVIEGLDEVDGGGQGQGPGRSAEECAGRRGPHRLRQSVPPHRHRPPGFRRFGKIIRAIYGKNNQRKRTFSETET